MVKKVANRVCVMNNGQIVEQGAVTQIFDQPAHEYTKHLLQSEPKRAERSHPTLEPLIHAENLRVWYPIKNCLLYTSDAADEGLGVDLGGRRIIKKKRGFSSQS